MARPAHIRDTVPGAMDTLTREEWERLAEYTRRKRRHGPVDRLPAGGEEVLPTSRPVSRRSCGSP